MSNTTANMLVTGVRFVKKKGVIHLEVEQAPATLEGILKLMFILLNLFEGWVKKVAVVQMWFVQSFFLKIGY